MSLCRFSTDNFRCDLYVYGAEDGWVIHVAGNRIVGPISVSPIAAMMDEILAYGDDPEEKERVSKEWLELERLHRLTMNSSARIPIGLPFDGQSYYGLDNVDLVVHLSQLRAAGYHFPDSVLEDAHQILAEEGPNYE